MTPPADPARSPQPTGDVGGWILLVALIGVGAVLPAAGTLAFIAGQGRV